MQVQFNDIRGGERLLWQIRQEELIDDARASDANGTLLLAGWMGRHDHAARSALGAYGYPRAIVEATHHLALQSAAGTDQVADADAPGPADG
jgi:hypothetical protein